MPSQKDGIGQAGDGDDAQQADRRSAPRSRAISTPGRHREPGAERPAPGGSAPASARHVPPISSMHRPPGPQRACRDRRAAPAPTQATYCRRTGWSSPMPRAQLGDALGRDLGVGAQHDRHGVAGDQPDHQEDDDRDAEQHDRRGRARRGRRGAAIMDRTGSGGSRRAAAGRPAAPPTGGGTAEALASLGASVGRQRAVGDDVEALDIAGAAP